MSILYICRSLKIPPVLLPGMFLYTFLCHCPPPPYPIMSMRNIFVLYVNSKVFLLSESDRIVIAPRWHFVLSTVKSLVLVTWVRMKILHGRRVEG